MATSKLVASGKWFALDTVDSKGNFKAKCLTCQETKCGSKNTSANLLKHLQKMHPKENEEYQKFKNSKPLPATQSTIEESFRKKSCTQAECKQLVVKFIVQCGLPLRLVEEKSFKNLISRLSNDTCHAVARKTLTNEVHDMFEKEMEDIKTTISQLKYVCTTADIWSDRKRSFLGMTAHWIEPTNLTRHSKAIACDRFPGNHTYDIIAEKICAVHEKFGMSLEMIIRCITDNASNFAKSFREYGVTIYDEDDNNVIEEDEDLEFASAHLDDEELNLFSLPKQEPCGSHTLNLIPSHDISKAIEPNNPKRKKPTNKPSIYSKVLFF